MSNCKKPSLTELGRSLCGWDSTSLATHTFPLLLRAGKKRFINLSNGENFLQRSLATIYGLLTCARFNSDDYLRNPVLYDGVTKKSWRKGKRSKPFVHYFNTTGIMQHNDIAPLWHPTDVGAIKVASHLQQFIRMKFGWDFYATGPE